METFDLSTTTGASKSASRPRMKGSEQWIWLNAAAIGASLCALFGMLLLLFVKGLAHFWPADIAQIDYTNTFGESGQLYGQIIEVESVPIEQFLESGRSFQGAAEEGATVERWLVKSGSRRLSPPDFRWVFSAQVNGTSYPRDLTVFQRMEWGDLYGMPLALSEPNKLEKVFPETSSDNPALLMDKLQLRLEQVRETRRQISSLESGEVRRISVQLEEARSQLNKGSFKGAASIGVRPMFGKNTPNLETYIFDFSGDIYGAQVSIALVEYLRPELSFDTVDILVKQMASDCEKAKEILCKT